MSFYLVVIPKRPKLRIMKEGAGNWSFKLSLTFFKKRRQATQFEAQIKSITSSMMLEKGKKGKKPHRKEASRVFQFQLELPVPKARNATDVVIHSPRNTWNTARLRMLRAEPATKLDITKSVVRSQGIFQGRRVLRKHTYWRKLPLPHSIFNEAGQGIITSRDEYAVFQDQSFQGFDHRVWMWNESYFH